MRKQSARTVIVTCLALLHAAGARAAEKRPSEEDIRRMTEAAPKEARVRPGKPRRLLIFTLCKGFKHGSIPWGSKALEIMGRKTGAYESVVSKDIEMFRPESLARFDAVCMNNTTGTLFKDKELRESLLEFVRSGGGIVGIHAATDCFYDWADYGEMMGAYFSGHPWNEKVGVKLDDPEHPLLQAFGGKGFDVTDEIYQFKAPYSRDAVRVLLSLDANRTNMNKARIRRTDGDFAVSWIQSYGEGRVFYCSLGHRNEIFWNPLVLRCYLDGIQFAVGDLAADTTPVPLDPSKIDPYMGEYEGLYEDGEGGAVLAKGVVVAEGGGGYRAVLTAPADVPPGGATEYDKNAAAAFDHHAQAALRLLERAAPEGGARAVRVELTTGGGDAGGGEPLEVYVTDDPKGEGGVSYTYYEESLDKLPDFEKLTPVKTGVAKYFDIGPRERNDNFAFRFTAFVKIPEDGLYTFATASDDGSQLFIGSKRIVDNDGLHGRRRVTGKIELTAGMHPVTVTFFEKGGGEVLEVGYEEAAQAPEDEEEGLTLTGGAGGVAWEGGLAGGTLTAAAAAAGPRFTLRRVFRKSPTEAIAPPPGAIVLLPYTPGERTSLDEWTNENWRRLPDGSVEVKKGNTRTVRKFSDIWLHLEFMVPFEPTRRGQGRGNSGIGIMGRYEVQVLDSFGLAPRKGDCGAVYAVKPPRVNASLPPGRWQTFDITFRAPRFDAQGELQKLPVITVIHNGVVVHKDFEIERGTGIGPRGHVREGSIKLQDHGHPVRFRNIWVVELGE